jgi:hypothetical protein
MWVPWRRWIYYMVDMDDIQFREAMEKSICKLPEFDCAGKKLVEMYVYV